MSLLILESCEIVDIPLPNPVPVAPGVPSEQDRKVGYWTNILIQTVPLEDLRGAFDVAVANHTDARRPVNPIDVKTAYGELLARRERDRRAAVEREALEDNDGRECSFCGPERVASIFFPATGKEVVAPCRECRPAAFSTFMAQYHERHAAEESPVAQVFQAGRKLLGEDLKCDNPKCSRGVVNTYGTTFKEGGPCNYLLNRYTSDEGEPELCEGVFVKIPAAG